MPLALLAVGSHLDAARYDVRIIDGRLEADPVAAILSEVDDSLCLGISVLTGDPIRDALEVTRAARARRPDLPIIWGGWHPSLFPADTLGDEEAIDATVCGQGEVTFTEIVARLAVGERNLEGVAGCATRTQAGDVFTNPVRPMHDINSFPNLSYGLIPVERYMQLKGRRQLDYVSSQGCRFRCSFCADPLVYRRRWYGLEPARIGEHLEALCSAYGCDEVSFQDETFFTSDVRVAGIAEELLRRKLDVTWTATMRADQGARIDEHILALARAAGLSRVMIGVESGSQEMLDRMHKDTRVEQAICSVERCRRLGLAVTLNLIVGFPDEPAESVEQTLVLAKELRARHPDLEAAIFYYKPYPAAGNDAVDVRVPRTLQQWSLFDYVSGPGPWVSPQVYSRVEGFRFYQQIAWGRHSPLLAPLQAVARWRCRHDIYTLPIEKTLIQRLRPSRRLA